MAAALAPKDPLTPNAKPVAPATAPAAPPPAANDPSQQTEAVTVHAPKPFSRQEMAAKVASYEDEQQEILTKRGALKPPVFDPPKQPTMSKTDPIEAWGSSAMVLATIGSMFTRTPLTTALNSAAGVMKAIKANDLEAATENFDNWKTAYDEYNKAYGYQTELYKSALTQSTADERASTAKLTAYLHAMSDNTALAAMEQNGLMGFERIRASRERTNAYLQTQAVKLIKNGEIVKFINSPEFKADYAAAQTPQEKLGLMFGATSGADPEVAKMMAGQAMSGDPKAYTNARGESGAATVAMARSYQAKMMRDQKLTPADLSKRSLLFNAVGAGLRTANVTAARIGLGVAEMNALIPKVREASAALKRTNYPTINSWVNALRKEGGSKQVKELTVRLQGLQTAFSQVLTRGGVPTDAVRHLANELMSSSDPEGVLDTALAAMTSEAEAVQGAPGVVRADLLNTLPGSPTGKKYNSPDEVKAALASGEIESEDDAAAILRDDFGFE